MVISAATRPDGLPPSRLRVNPRNPSGSPPKSSSELRDARVEISPQAKKLRAHNGLLHSTLSEIEEELFPEGRRPYEEANRNRYPESLAGDARLSPESTAERIVGGVKGYIFRAFMAQHPDATPEDFERFKAAVMRGFERGLFDVRTSPALEPELAGDLARTEDHVREALGEFFAQQSERAELRALL